MSKIQITVTHTIDVDGDKCGGGCEELKFKGYCFRCRKFDTKLLPETIVGYKYPNRCQACIDAERKADILHAPSYDKGYDANKKDYDEVWADLGKAIELIKELVDALSESSAVMSFIVHHDISNIDDKYFATNNAVIAKAKEFLK